MARQVTKIMLDLIVFNRRNIFKNLINVKHVINHEHNAANNRFVM